MPFGMMGSAMGMKQKNAGQQKNKFQQVRDQAGQGIGPSSNMMGGAMGGMMPGRAMAGNMMGRAQGQMGALGSALGGFKQQRQLGGMRQGFMPRQDMMDYGNTGMSNTQLPPPDQSIMQESNAMVQPQMEDPMQQALASYGPQSSLRRGIGPRFR